MLHDGQTAFSAPNIGAVKPCAACTAQILTKDDDLCDNCRAVVQVDLLDGQTLCPKCKSTKITPYDDPRLSGPTGRTTVTEWNMVQELGRNLKLSDGSYRCPQCNQMTLHFTEGNTNWD